MVVPQFHFDRGGPFYPLVVNYLVLLHGFNFLAATGVILIAKKIMGDPSSDLIARPWIPQGLANVADPEVKFGIEKVLGPLSLASRIQTAPVISEISNVAQTVLNSVNSEDSLLPYTIRAAGFLLVLAYETTRSLHDEGPLWEFLRHCRNAAAHNGRWSFYRGEPSHPAEWRGFRLDASIDGQPLFRQQDGTGTLRPGDPIILLWDIEQAYQGLKAKA